jgi:site-specific DNA recombinase
MAESRRATQKLRCAIYTRKSSEEGLEQAFNSLDAQHEACAAFILSQKNEGWTALPILYNDGGFSGGTMDRPALKLLFGPTPVASAHAPFRMESARALPC